ncbi:MAG: AMP-binding protein [Acidobacteriota bacterium]
MEHTIGQVLRTGATTHFADSPAIVAARRAPLSHKRLWHHVQGVVAWLNSAGIGRGDRVAMVLPNGPEMAAAFLGVSAGAVSAPLDPAYHADQFSFHLIQLHAKALVVQGGVDSPARDVARDHGIRVIDLWPVGEDDAGIFTLNGDTLNRDDGVYAEPLDVALILHTSGTTSRPRIVPLTHANLSASAANIAGSLSLSARDRSLNVMPLFHVHGLVASTLAAIAAGGSVVCAPAFDGSAFFEWLNDFQPTWFTAVPTMHQEILRRAAPSPGSVVPSRLRFIRSCSAALSPRTMSELEAVFGVPVIEAYGMTEAAHQIASNPLPPASRVPGAVGLPTGCEVTIRDEQGALLPIGDTGEVVIRGPNVTRGYETDPITNALTFTDGWCRTGDQGRLDSEGYLVLTGRLKEIINRGGEKVSPREIDDVLLRHPDVREAAAFGVAHPTLGESIAAAVVPRDGKTLTEVGVRNFAFQHLPDFKVPSRVVVVQAIPKGPTGKLQRMDLALRLAQELDQGYEPPASELEHLSSTLFAQVLQVSRAGRHDNFFALGGDSIQAMQVIARLGESLTLDIPPTSMFRHPTPASLAAELARMQQDRDLASIATQLQGLSQEDARRLLQHAAGQDA